MPPEGSEVVVEPDELTKLKSSEPDLTIFLGVEGKPSSHHSVMMASHSAYIDTMLASSMRESRTLEIRFPEIPPEVWSRMIALLEDPVKACEMTVLEAMEFAPIYDKYGFQKGSLLCSHVLARYIEENEDPIDLDLQVAIFDLADRLVLDKAYEACVSNFAKRLADGETRIMFTEKQMEKLAPLIAKEGTLLSYAGAEKAEVLSPLFPQNFVLRQNLDAAKEQLEAAVTHIRVSGSLCKADGIFVRQSFSHFTSARKGHFGGQEVKFEIQCVENVGWQIVGEPLPVLLEVEDEVLEDWIGAETKTLWQIPNSANLLLPPHSGWQAVHEEARGGDLEVQYIYRLTGEE